MKLCCSLCKTLRWFLIADDNHVAAYRSNLQFIDSQMYWFIFISQLQYVFQGLNPIWGARVAQWWEHSPPTNVARVQLPASTPYVGWVGCWFSPLLQKVFLRYSGFPLSSKTNTSKFQFDLGRTDTFKRVHMNSYVLRGLTNNLRFLLPTTLISPSYPGGYSRFSEWSRSDAILENEKTLGRGCINLL